ELEKAVKVRTSQLQHINQQLLKAEKIAALGYMAAGVAKEINTPINTILENLQELNHGGGDASEQQELISNLEQEALRCQQIIQGLLDFSGQNNHKPK